MHKLLKQKAKKYFRDPALQSKKCVLLSDDSFLLMSLRLNKHSEQFCKQYLQPFPTRQ